jgi:hypothetical protein
VEPAVCNKSEPESIAKIRRGLPERGILGFAAKPYGAKHKDDLQDLGARFVKAGDGRPRFYISSQCVNAISELLEYSIEVKGRDHTIDGIRYGIPLKSTAPLSAFRFG